MNEIDNKFISQDDFENLPQIKPQENNLIFRTGIYDKDGKIIGRFLKSVYKTNYLPLMIDLSTDTPKEGGDQTRYESKHLKKPILWCDFNNKVFPTQQWRIKNLIPFEGFVILAAPSGEKKTFFAMNMAKCIAKGEPFLGNTEFQSTKSRVLYIDQETSQSELHRRGRLLDLHTCEDNLWLSSCNDLNLQNKDAMEEFMDIVNLTPIDVVIIDTFRSVAGGLNEDKAEDVRAFMNKFKSLKDRGVTIIFIDHCRKPERFDGKIPRKEQLLGSQDKAASIEILIMIKSLNGENDIQVFVLKNRLAASIDPFQISLKEERDKNSELKLSLNYIGPIQRDDTQKKKAKQIINDILLEQPILQKEIISLLHTKYGIGSKNTANALKELDQEKCIKRESKRGGKMCSIIIKNQYDSFVIM